MKVMIKILIIIKKWIVMKKNNISFKDDSARVVRKESIYYRYIFDEYKQEYDHLMGSGLYKELIMKGLLVEHKEVDFFEIKEEIYKVILPIQIAFQSYPFEWSFQQWKKAILAYLEINLISLNYGMILKDASPYNFFLKGGKAVLLDTSSFKFFKINDNWTAYYQFCKEFLSPISLIYCNGGEWSRLTMSNLKGMDICFVSKQLPLKSYFNLTIFLNIHLHSIFLKKASLTKKRNKSGFTLQNLIFLQSHLYNQISKWKIKNENIKVWTNYYNNNIESLEYVEAKEFILRMILETIKPKSVLDLGANIGKFSFISAEYSAKVIALESDLECVDLIENEIQRLGINNVFTLNAKITEFSNGLGLNGQEVVRLSDRIVSEFILALALVHHLYVTFYLSFDQIAEQLFNLSTRFVLVEFVPDNDPKVNYLKASICRNINYNDIEFETAFYCKFKLIEKYKISNSFRVLYLFEKL